MKVLDVACGPKSMWFDKNDPRAEFLDIREGMYLKSNKQVIYVAPDEIGSFENLNKESDLYKLVVFDPPHIKRNVEGDMTLMYGNLKKDWKDSIKLGFSECFRVLQKDGVLVFKWSETQFKLKDVLELTEEKPLFGHRSGKKMNTHWLIFMKS